MKGSGSPFRRSDSGRGSILWNGTAGSAIQVWPHNLGVVPKTVLLRMDDVGQVACLTCYARDDKTFTTVARASTAIANGATTPFEWMVGA